jgi:hypothetical protein
MEDIDDDLIEAFRAACEAAGGTWRGEYSGRGGFKGYGADFDSAADLVVLGAEMAEELSELIAVQPHIDSMGMGVVVAWPARCFEV